MSWLIEPFRYEFMQVALLASVLIGVTCAVLGVYVVQRRMAFIGDALAHTTLPGLAISHLNGWNLSVGALVAAVCTALGIGWISRREMLKEDTAIGVLFTGMFALGVLIMTRVRSFRDLSHMLFGNILEVTLEDLRLIGLVCFVVLALLAAFHKEFELTSFDPTHAESMGLRPDWMRYMLLLLLAATVVTSIQAVGVVLTNALLVTPAATASMVSHRLPRVMLLSAVIAVLSAIAGLYISYFGHASSGAAIVLACTGCFLIVWLVQSTRQRFFGGEENRPA